MSKKKKSLSILDIIKSIRKPTPPPTKFFQDETKNIKKERKKNKQELKKYDWKGDN